MRHQFVHRSAGVAVALTLLAAGLAGRQTPAQQPQQPPRPTFRTEANYVRVDVYPTRGGVPVKDLKAEDFELLEDGAPQTIDAFEHVVITPAGPQASRVDPNSVREGEQMAANPRSRVFVVFLDVPHVSVQGSHGIQEPLIRLMDRILGADDLVAVMTPAMSPAQMTFGRKTEVIQRGLRDNWPWGMRHSILPMDKREEEYDACYPPLTGERSPSALAQAMIDRRRERMVLDAMYDLVRYLGGIREERKAILTVTEGWGLYRENPQLMKLREDPHTGYKEAPPGIDPIGVDPNGKLTTRPARNSMNSDRSKYECDTERMALANMDNDRYFRDLLDVANRANASFYPIDPRGLAAFDSPIGPRIPPPVSVDQAILRHKLEILQTLAENTDGMAVINSNDLDKGLRRIADDLTSYYLLGYYSTNTKLDGGFRSIKVRVKRPGVDVRARRGYRAATADELSAARAAAAPPVPETTSTAAAAIASLARIRPELRFRVHAVPVTGAAGRIASVWVAGELLQAGPEWAQGGTVAIEVGADGQSASALLTLKPGERAFLTSVPVEAPLGRVDVRARAAPAPPAIPLADAVRLDVGAEPPQPLLFRRGPSTGNRLQPAADFRFSRTERVRLEVPLPPGASPGAGRLLDRAGQPLPIPVTVGERTDTATGQRWLTADLVLAPLAAGDYVVEFSLKHADREERTLTGLRVAR